MTDIFFPADLIPTGMMIGVDDFTAVDESATVGSMQSSTLYGTRRWRVRMDFAVLTGAQLARFEALIAALRGRQNRVWISPGRAARGSFPDAEILTNNTFVNGATGWANFLTAFATLSVADRSIRTTRVSAGGVIGPAQTLPTLPINTPYAGRALICSGRGPSSFSAQLRPTSGNLASFSISGNYAIQGWSPTVGAGSQFGIFESSATGGIAGDYFDMPWASVSQCVMVDNAPNALLNSDDITNASWTKTSCTATANVGTAPDGTSALDKIVEAAASAQHLISQTVARTSVAEDLCSFICATRFTGTRDIQVQVDDGAGNGAAAIFNLGAGTIGTITTTGTGTNARAFMRDMGNGRYFCYVIAYCPATTSRRSFFLMINAGSNNYLGDGASAIGLWRGGNCSSSFPVFPTATAGAAFAGNTQTGNQLYLKGLPVSTNGLLLQGDMIEIDMPTNSQLVRATARLDSDAAGLGVLQFEHALKQSPVDNAAVVIQQPMGRFVLANSTLGVEYVPGVFGQASLEFVEAAP